MIKQLLYLLILAITLPSCSQETVLQLPDEARKLVVNCAFSQLQPREVRISHNLFTPGDEYTEIQNASVRIFENGELSETLVYDAKSKRYKGKTIPKAGLAYMLKASAPGFEKEASAPGMVPVGVPEVSNIGLSTATSGKTLSFTLADKAGEPNYYFASAFRHDTLYNGVVAKETLTTPINDGFVWDFNAYNRKSFFTDKSFDGKTVSPRMEVYLGRAGKKYLEVASLSPELYEYFKTLELHGYDDFILTEKTAVFNNIENGLGIFGGMSMRVEELK